jgi:hypothetical protein
VGGETVEVIIELQMLSLTIEELYRLKQKMLTQPEL